MSSPLVCLCLVASDMSAFIIRPPHGFPDADLADLLGSLMVMAMYRHASNTCVILCLCVALMQQRLPVHGPPRETWAVGVRTSSQLAQAESQAMC